MRIIRTEDYQAMSAQVAALIAAQVVSKPDSVLGLATGSTPIGAYHLLAEWHKKGMLSFAQIRSVNLDEYCGLAPDHEQSYRRFMGETLFDHIDIKPENTHVPNGLAEDFTAECARYDGLIARLGGVDLQLLGLGHNGHIGFNEPGASFVLPTHPVSLSESTIGANSRLFASRDDVPRQAITMGVGSIMRAKRVLVAVSGADKADVVTRAFSGPVTPEVPASILQLHPDVVLVGDRAVLSELGV